MSAGAPFSPLNHCLRADRQGLGPIGGGDVQGLARKHVLFVAAPVYTVTAQRSKWKSWSSSKPATVVLGDYYSSQQVDYPYFSRSRAAASTSFFSLE